MSTRLQTAQKVTRPHLCHSSERQAESRQRSPEWQRRQTQISSGRLGSARAHAPTISNESSANNLAGTAPSLSGVARACREYFLAGAFGLTCASSPGNVLLSARPNNIFTIAKSSVVTPFAAPYRYLHFIHLSFVFRLCQNPANGVQCYGKRSFHN